MMGELDYIILGYIIGGLVMYGFYEIKDNGFYAWD